ncbi:transcription factor HES-7.1-like [Parambassis ranga]|uniref:Transcription factor HES-7.1-like n=1 Tax=Parambassis ranga TaxID=210632 RepID=A0A6P7JYC3_9TELE|nr:transcription factor HES-7.1-like [Parambassis ranga]
MKSQVEKRRRERMNRSLERLRSMLLQEPQQGETPHRVEKAEILEHTVLFLQSTAQEDKPQAGGAGQKHAFQDGFSTCLQRAAQFMGPEGESLRLGLALDASLAARLARSDSDNSSLPPTKSILRLLRQKCRHRLMASGCTDPYPLPGQENLRGVHPQGQSQLETRAERRASKQSSPQRFPVSHTLWRPWP